MKKRHILALLVAIGLSHAAVAQPTLSGTPEELRELLGLAPPSLRVVTMRGEANKTAYADRAIVTIVVTTEDRTLAGALQANAGLRTTLVQTLAGAGIDPQEINTERFSTSPQFGLFGSDPNSFQVVNRIEVTVTDERQFEAVGRIVDASSEVRIAGTQFEHSLEDEFEDEVRAAAVQDAMTERGFYEQALGLTLRPVSFRSGPAVMPLRAGFSEARVMDELMVTAAQANGRAGGFAGQPVGFDKIEYRAQVQIDFEIVASAD